MVSFLILIVIISSVAMAKEAVNVVEECKLVGSGNKNEIVKSFDKDYKTFYKTGKNKNNGIICTMPEGKLCSGVYIKFIYKATDWCLQVKNGKDEWQTVTSSSKGYISDFLPLDNVKEFRIHAPNRKEYQLNIIELEIFDQGEIPAYVQRWKPPLEKSDILLVHAHSDDEHVFMGGVLPYYAGELGKKVQTMVLVPSTDYRKHEYLDGLWHSGVKNYPLYGGFPDAFSYKLKDMYKAWNEETLIGRVVGAIRRTKPDVVVTHDIKGEYGHGGHQACADAVINAISKSNKPKYYIKSYKEYGGWEISKLYIHLYEENKIKMDFNKPLSKFNGKTALTMAKEAFKLHTSQQKISYFPTDEGPYSIEDYGLYYSSVGDDVLKNDMLENIK
ncbi:MAG: hypothetical protein GYA87_10100 [Christensenellaceae bacterium]|nr:hypothetical protein [Christensenellaceae bacterium]